MLVLDQGDGFQTAPDRHLLMVEDHLFGRRGDAHQARGALAVQAHARNGGGQAGGKSDLARDIGAGRTLLQGRAQNHILDLGGIDACALDRMTDSVGAQLLRLGVVEGAPIGPADRRAGGGDDDGFAHDSLPGLGARTCWPFRPFVVRSEWTSFLRSEFRRLTLRQRKAPVLDQAPCACCAFVSSIMPWAAPISGTISASRFEMASNWAATCSGASAPVM